jgi:GTP-binding protein
VNPYYHRAQFMTSAARLGSAPEDSGYEVAFAGRSNSGKSSAINLLTQQRNLARVSKTPGRTQLLNFFRLDDHRRLVDLPGYGYADVPITVQRSWRSFIEAYLSRRTSLKGVCLVMDSRHPLLEFDRRMLEWCLHFALPVHVALTKSDKLSRSAALATLKKVRGELVNAYGSELSLQLFSVPKRTGIDEAHAVLDRWLGLPRLEGPADGVVSD